MAEQNKKNITEFNIPVFIKYRIKLGHNLFSQQQKISMNANKIFCPNNYWYSFSSPMVLILVEYTGTPTVHCTMYTVYPMVLILVE